MQGLTQNCSISNTPKFTLHPISMTWTFLSYLHRAIHQISPIFYLSTHHKFQAIPPDVNVQGTATLSPALRSAGSVPFDMVVSSAWGQVNCVPYLRHTLLFHRSPSPNPHTPPINPFDSGRYLHILIPSKISHDANSGICQQR